MRGNRRRLMMEQSTEDILKTTIRIDQNLTDPATMITRIVDEGGIEAIRANSHRYVGVFDSTANLMSLRQLDDNDGTKYLDGTAAPITTLGNDVWMKLPQFFYKAEEYETDVWDITFAYGSKPDDTFKEWDGKDLIGVYKAYISDGKTYSSSGKTPTVNVSRLNFLSYTNNRGGGFSLIKWKHHCMMAALFYAYYCNTNSQSVCGTGQGRSSTGHSDKLSMVDTNGSSVNVNFWGLEDWWGNWSEYLGNIVARYVSGQHRTTVTEDDGTLRYIFSPVALGCTLKMVLGENLDMLNSSRTVLSVYNMGYCDLCGTYNDYTTKDSNYIRSAAYDNTNGGNGVAYIFVHTQDSSSRPTCGTRLSYRGDYIITD